LTVASDRQIAANRRNAGASTGPRSSSGKQRASYNAYRHGLAAGSPRLADVIERYARNIAGKHASPLILECARAAAQAHFDLARIREVN
jgi:hypothetical protein